MDHLAPYLARTITTDTPMKTIKKNFILALNLLFMGFATSAQFNSKTYKNDLASGHSFSLNPLRTITPWLELSSINKPTQLKESNLFNEQGLKRLYFPTWATYLADERNVSNGEQNITPGFGDYKMPFYVYFRKYDAIYEAIERQKH